MNIFCHKCGKMLETGDEFCQSCGVKISTDYSNKDLSNHKSLKRGDLEKKAWYRAMKVIYFVVIIIAVFAISVISWSAKPTKKLDGYNSSIVCSTGKAYAPGKNSIYLYSWEDDLSSSDDKDARILCKYDTLNFRPFSSEVIEKNYTFIPVYESMKYGAWVGYTILALFILWLVSYLVKIGFLYIVVGEKPKINIS